MRLVGLALKFRMKLAGDEKWMAGQFDHLRQFLVGGPPAEHKTSFDEGLVIFVVELIAMAVAFVNDECAVEPGGMAPHG